MGNISHFKLGIKWHKYFQVYTCSVYDEVYLYTNTIVKLFVLVTDRVASYLKKLSLSKSRVAFKPTGGRKLEYKEVKNTTMTCLMFKKCLSVVTKQLQLEMLTGNGFIQI